MKYTTLLLDFDDTLVDFDDAEEQAFSIWPKITSHLLLMMTSLYSKD